MTDEHSLDQPTTTSESERDSASQRPETDINMAKQKPAGFAQFSKTVSRSALFGVSEDLPHVVELSLVEVETNPDQPRQHFDQEQLRELADSINENGLIHPITVAKTEAGYIIVAGERRFRAHQLLERETIPAIITTGDPEVIALIENVQRVQLDPLEEADAYQRLMDKHGYTQEELGRVVGKRQNTVSEALSLNRLPEALIETYRASDKTLSKSVLVELAKASEEQQADLLEEALTYQLGLRAVRERRKSPTPSKSGAPSAANARKDRLIRSLAATLKRAQADARAEDFPAGSKALERLRELKQELDETLSPVLEQGRLEMD